MNPFPICHLTSRLPIRPPQRKQPQKQRINNRKRYPTRRLRKRRVRSPRMLLTMMSWWRRFRERHLTILTFRVVKLLRFRLNRIRSCGSSVNSAISRSIRSHPLRNTMRRSFQRRFLRWLRLIQRSRLLRPMHRSFLRMTIHLRLFPRHTEQLSIPKV